MLDWDFTRHAAAPQAPHTFALADREQTTHGSTREIGDPLRRTRPRPAVTWATEVAVCYMSFIQAGLG